MRTRLIAAAAALTVAFPALAQDQASPPMTDAAAANHAAHGTAMVQLGPQTLPGDQAAYDADMAAYRAEVRANQRANRANAEIAARNERAYADAMRAWRIQVIDCKRGITAACRAPTPRPGDFM